SMRPQNRTIGCSVGSTRQVWLEVRARARQLAADIPSGLAGVEGPRLREAQGVSSPCRWQPIQVMQAFLFSLPCRPCQSRSTLKPKFNVRFSTPLDSQVLVNAVTGQVE